MKKRMIIALVVSVLALGMVVAACLLLNTTNEEEKPTAEDLESIQSISYLKVTDCEQIFELAEEYRATLSGVEDNILAINDVTVNGKKTNITFAYNGESVEMVRWSYEICAAKDVDVNDEQALAKLKENIDDIASFLGVILDENITTDRLYAADGYSIDAPELSTYGQLLTGQAVFDLSVKDREGAIWNARTNLSEDGVLSVHFYRSLQKKFNDTITADITLD